MPPSRLCARGQLLFSWDSARERLDVTILVQLSGVKATIAVNFALATRGILHRSPATDHHFRYNLRVRQISPSACCPFVYDKQSPTWERMNRYIDRQRVARRAVSIFARVRSCSLCISVSCSRRPIARGERALHTRSLSPHNRTNHTHAHTLRLIGRVIQAGQCTRIGAS